MRCATSSTRGFGRSRTYDFHRRRRAASVLDSGAMTDARLPLDGIRVLELAQIVAGPFCGTLMAEFGAEVIKTELPGKGDDLRRLGPTEDGCNYWYAVDNRGKRVVTLDLRTRKGQELVRRLVPLCDVVIENF